MRLIFPPLALCTDNAAMIGNVAVDRFREGRNQPLWDVLPRKKWSIERLFADRDAYGNEIEPEDPGEEEGTKT
jgi:N6-L-threonylcarbamoyladenine synthase